MSDIGVLLDMLSYRRPAGSATENEFRSRFIMPLGAIADDYGNLHVWLPNADGTPSRMLWSCHTDTVHRGDGRQTLNYDPVTGVIKLSKRSKKNGSNCLGADDTAGCFILCSMIRAKVPGHYIFHYGEESGGIGSSELVKYEPGLLENAEIAIALDRRGTGDIITSQFGWNTASEAFAKSLGDELGRVDSGLTYKSAFGIYTDTAEYVFDVAECSNLSVGYYDEHRSSERLESRHTLRLLAALCKIDHNALTVDREPSSLYEDCAVIESTYGAGETVVYAEVGEQCPACHVTLLTDDYCYKCGWSGEVDGQSIYLTPEYADVQKALRRAQDEIRQHCRRPAQRAIVIPMWTEDRAQPCGFCHDAPCTCRADTGLTYAQK